jgi:hypothetical protein
MEDAELEGCEFNFPDRDFARPEVWTLLLLLLPETDECCDVDLSKGAASSGGSMAHHWQASRLAPLSSDDVARVFKNRNKLAKGMNSRKRQKAPYFTFDRE